jgi:hypothetical protein
MFGGHRGSLTSKLYAHKQIQSFLAMDRES